MACSTGFGADGLDPSAPNISSPQALEAPPTPRGRSAKIAGRSAPNDPDLSTVRFPPPTGVQPDPTAIRQDTAVGLGFRHQVPERTVEAEGFWYAIRLKANAVLERQIAHLLKRPVGRPSKKPKA